MDLLNQDSSPYINDLDFPNTSPASAQHNISPHISPFDQFEFSNLQSSAFPHTPSYNGSYHNSPYSGHSELSFGGDSGEQYSLFDDEPVVNVGVQEEYDPSEYDPPSSGGLLMFDTDFGDQVSVSVTPAPIDYSSPQAYDHSSPSSNGGGDSNNEGQPRSRGSSVSSNHNHIISSPRLDVTQGFENMHFESPHWGTQVLPVDRSLSPPHKPQSPPQLMIPDSTSPSGNMFPQSSPPVINAPDGDGGLMGAGPQLHIVPATPVSGGGGTSQPVPFQSTLETLHQGKWAFDFHFIDIYILLSLFCCYWQARQMRTSSNSSSPTGTTDHNNKSNTFNRKSRSPCSTPVKHSFPTTSPDTATKVTRGGCPPQMLKYTQIVMVVSCILPPKGLAANPTPTLDPHSGLT